MEFTITMKKILWIALTATFITACSAHKPYVIEETKTIGSLGSGATITVIDQRPGDDKKFSVGSFMVFKSDYGIMTLGDKGFSPALDELLRMRVHKAISTWEDQPKEIDIVLNKMIFQANQQADLLQSSSTSAGIGPLGVLIAETMHGKEFELDYDKTRPFILGFVQATVELRFADNKKIKKDISVSKIENYSNHMDFEGREAAAISVANQVFDSFTENL